ncbi:TIGR02281 family clan AA aspartic protease [Pseudooceanicola sediminis]|uniref:TIGR02281 family clan AA aspartic protease n=1 Tax=Pseudooceanicola sediminis TaxID=2211117 RepID=A0A399J2P3_9RHOB|nr:TIGR02281 family clan AA aspartic protease [Pseudooceanicola sediminis]KAA2317231.1 TIGR02281 family clan AA aspartic protease [Puniceibacterium sp. HSS470]RII39584.1 TIGR02281 family clan AA aspartic protease [Pseudooceanicola sediminis]|tara:strand:- start:20858 stop:21439 length:582 start_codon:yes stop_codon:yes gene_type:complete
MSGNEIGQLSYLLVLLLVVAGYFFVSNRDRVGQMARHALLWALIFVGVIAAVGMWDNIRTTLTPMQHLSADGASVRIPQSADGHYYVTLEVNGTAQPFLIDTGATDIVLTRAAAQNIGIDPNALVYSGSAGTANGMVRTAPVTLDTVALGPVTDTNVRAMVNDGDLFTPLLGMSYLNRYAKIEIGNGAMTLVR